MTSLKGSSPVVQEFLEQIINAIPEPMFVKDEKSIYLIVNDAGLALFGFKRDQVIGKSDFDLFPEQIASTFQKEDAETLISGCDVHDRILPMPNGVVLSFQIKKSVLKSPDGKPLILGIINDVTDFKRESSYLQETKSALDESQRIAKIGTWSMDLITNKLWWSDQFYSLFGYRRGEFVPDIHNTMALVHPDESELAREHYADMFSGKINSYSKDVRMLCADGTYLLTRAQGRIIRDDKGVAIRLLGTNQDITDLIRKERQAIEMQDSLRLALKAANLGFWEIDVAKNKLTVSDESARMFQIQNRESPLAEYIARVHPDDLQAVIDSDLVRASAGREKNTDLSEAENQFRIILPSGEIRHVTSIGAIYRDKNKKPYRIVGINADITDFVRQRETLQKSAQSLEEEARYARLMKDVAEAINMNTSSESTIKEVLKLTSRYLGWSAAHAFVTFSPATELKTSGIWHEEVPDQVRNLKEATSTILFKVNEGIPGKVLAKGAAAWTQIDLINDPLLPRAGAAVSDGITTALGIPLMIGADIFGVLEFFTEERVPIEQSLLDKLSPIGVQLGRVIERKIYAIEREDSQKTVEVTSRYAALGELASNIAHEINTPLATVSVDVRRIQRTVELGKPISPEKFLPACERVIQTVQKISDIIVGMKSLTRGSEEGSPMVQVSLASIVQQTLAVSKKKLSDLGIRLEQSDETKAGAMVMGLPIQLFQVMVNLLNNAIDAVESAPPHPDKWIKIAIYKDGPYINLCVANSGPKIPENVALRLFERHFTTKPVGKGTGLGLHLCKRIVKNHHGRVYLDTELNHTSFIVSLPEASESETVETTQP